MKRQLLVILMVLLCTCMVDAQSGYINVAGSNPKELAEKITQTVKAIGSSSRGVKYISAITSENKGAELNGYVFFSGSNAALSKAKPALKLVGEEVAFYVKFGYTRKRHIKPDGLVFFTPFRIRKEQTLDMRFKKIEDFFSFDEKWKFFSRTGINLPSALRGAFHYFPHDESDTKFESVYTSYLVNKINGVEYVIVKSVGKNLSSD